jgi:hypothetical protein
MTCTCCETVACCTGANCNTATRSQCAGPLNGTPNTVVGTCAAFVCLDTSGKQSCSLRNACSCAAASVDHRTRPTVQPPTCNCTTLSSLGFTAGGCRWYHCEQCEAGDCVSGCSFPRECCAGTCCPLSQKCVNNTCVNKCATGTFCAGAGSAFNCCGANTKCCGTSGCLPTQISANFSVNVAANAWVSTGLTIPAGATVTITASGTAQWRLPTIDNIGPNGTDLYPIDGGCSPLSGVLHMRLIGRVGGVMFSVGASYTGEPGAGLLELRQNDTCVPDNSGSYTGTASYTTADPCPGFTPASIGEPIVYGPGEEPPKLLPGPGAALKDILKLGGIVASATCSCNARAAQMDAWGSGECIRRCREIVGWLKEESEKRDLWFFAPLGYALVFAAVGLAALKRFWKSNNQ